MKKVIYSCLLIIIYSCSKDSVDTFNPMLWSELNSPTSMSLVDVEFFDEDFGVTCGGISTLMKTENGGETWEELNINVSASFNTVFINNRNEFFTSRKGLYKTTDGGITFNEIGNLSSQFGTIFHIHFFSPQTGVIVKGAKVLRTENGGLSWNVVYSGNINATRLEIASNETIYLAGGSTYDSVSFGKLHKSINGGQTWQELDLPLPIRNFEIRSIEFINENYGFIATTNRNIYKTIDGGVNWTLVASGYVGSIADIHFLNENEGYMISGNSIYKSTDGGFSWNIEYEHEAIGFHLISMTSTPNGKLYAVGQDGVILKRDE